MDRNSRININSELIEIVPWQHEWSRKFRLERQSLLAALSLPDSHPETRPQSHPDSHPESSSQPGQPAVRSGSSSNRSSDIPDDKASTTSSKTPDARMAPESMHRPAGDPSDSANHHIVGGVHIEHIGSTSVEGLAAKPILDLMIGVEDWRDNSLLENTLEQLGYINAHPPQQLIPNTHFLFRRDDQLHRTHHLHIVEYESEFWTTRLLYRDFLRRNESIARLYGTLKTIGAEQHRYDRITAVETRVVISLSKLSPQFGIYNVTRPNFPHASVCAHTKPGFTRCFRIGQNCSSTLLLHNI